MAVDNGNMKVIQCGPWIAGATVFLIVLGYFTRWYVPIVLLAVLVAYGLWWGRRNFEWLKAIAAAKAEGRQASRP
jgi:hypothetical protein